MNADEPARGGQARIYQFPGHGRVESPPCGYFELILVPALESKNLKGCVLAVVSMFIRADPRPIKEN